MKETIENSVAPFWFWNDKLDPQKLVAQLQGIKSQGINAVTIHARYGLPQEDYLSEDWFHCYGVVLNQAQELGMGVWIYDDYNWPSGRAGGRITQNPDYTAKTARLDRVGNLVIEQADFQPAYTDEPGMVANFMGILNRGTVPFSDGLEISPLIWSSEETAEVREARLDFFSGLSNRYRENFLGRIHDWCRDHGVLQTGHVLVDEDPLELVRTQADPFAALAQFDIPGFDLIGGFNPESQILAAKLAQSVSETYGKIGVMAETFGGFGSGLTLRGMETVLNWEVRKAGVSMLVPHAIFYSDVGDRQYDYPPVLNDSTYWPAMKNLIPFFNQVQRQPGHPTDAVYFPTQAIQAEYNPGNTHEAQYISRAVQKKVADLTRNGIDFDLLNDEALWKRIFSGYDRLHVPAARVMSSGTMLDISKFADAGGTVVFLGERPRFATRARDQEVFDKLMAHLVDMDRVEDGDFPNLHRRKNIWNVIDREVKGWDYKHFHKLATQSPRKAQKYAERKGQLSRAWGKIERRFA